MELSRGLRQTKYVKRLTLCLARGSEKMVAVTRVIFYRLQKPKPRKHGSRARSAQRLSYTLGASQHLSLVSGRRLRGHVPALLSLGLPGARRAGPPSQPHPHPEPWRRDSPQCAPHPPPISNGPACPPSLPDPGCQPPRLLLTGPQRCPVLSHATVALLIPFLVPETLFLHLPSPTSLIFLENPFLYPQARLCCPFLMGLLQVPS